MSNPKPRLIWLPQARRWVAMHRMDLPTSNHDYQQARIICAWANVLNKKERLNGHL